MALATMEHVEDQLETFGLELGGPLRIGKLTRVPHDVDKKGHKSGWYIVYEIGIGRYAGAYGCWKLGDDKRKIEGEGGVSEVEYRSLPVKLPEPEFEPDFGMWENSRPAPHDHPYLVKKGIRGEGIREFGGHLLIPVIESGAMVGLQSINSGGVKKFVKGSKFQGGHFELTGDGTIAICEGYATGASIREATGWTVLIAFNAGNMSKVAKGFFNRPVVICGDNDEAGLKAVEQCKKVLGHCAVAVPKGDGNDWNDAGCDALSGRRGEAWGDLSVGGDAVAFLKQWSGFLKGLPKSEQMIQAQRFRDDHGVAKGLFGAIIGEAQVDGDDEERMDALRELSQYYCCEDKFYRVDISGRGHWRAGRDEIRPLIDALAGDDQLERNRLWQGITGDRRIGRFESVVEVDGQSSIDLVRNEEGSFTLIHRVSMLETLRSLKRRMGQVAYSPEMFKDYDCVVDVFKGALARKFVGSTKSTVYFRTCSDYGKTFFFDVDGLTLGVSNDYDESEFSGMDSHQLNRYLFLFIDEADKFTSTMKKDVLGYDRKYGGYQTLRLPLRVMACVNPVDDIEGGADEQVLKRVTSVMPKPVKLDEVLGAMDHTLHKAQWDAFIVDRLIEECEKVKDWGEAFDDFLSRYRDGHEGFSSLVSVLEDAVRECAKDIENGLNPKGTGNFEFARHIGPWEGGGFLIQSPSRTIRQLLTHYRPDREKAFRKKYRSMDLLAKDLGCARTHKLKSGVIVNGLLIN